MTCDVLKLSEKTAEIRDKLTICVIGILFFLIYIAVLIFIKINHFIKASLVIAVIQNKKHWLAKFNIGYFNISDKQQIMNPIS